ncbi:MAG: hypothetical protein A2Y79_01190 [Deltaproteobacteria bacterium RBG_13_43_22]|jgi:hypothetical protein|nr:MAG: hypothetical protein A2Y79_01190 [Deltaproteobacteria bacterium RBG_13_43_22]
MKKAFVIIFLAMVFMGSVLAVAGPNPLPKDLNIVKPVDDTLMGWFGKSGIWDGTFNPPATVGDVTIAFKKIGMEKVDLLYAIQGRPILKATGDFYKGKIEFYLMETGADVCLSLEKEKETMNLLYKLPGGRGIYEATLTPRAQP